MANQEPLYRAIIPEGTHLARSNNTEGAFRGAVLDDETNQEGYSGVGVGVEG